MGETSTTAVAPPSHKDTLIQNPFTRNFWLGEVDLRPLALMRIMMGLVTLWDLFRRSEEFIAWHTDEGVLPRIALVEGIARSWRLSVLDMMGTPGMVTVFFIVATLSAFCLTIGYKTRIANVLTWIAVVSLQERNLGVTDSSDTLYRVMLFWMCFGPSAAAYSLDRALADDDGKKKSWPPMGSAVAFRMMQLELVMLYFVTSTTKSGDHWRDGSALYRALQVWDFARPPANFYVENLSFLSKPMTWTALVVEFSIACLLWVPNVRIRKWLLLIATGFHLNIEFFMNVGMFSIMMPICYTLFLWDGACDFIDKHMPDFSSVVVKARTWGLHRVGDSYLPDWVGRPINRNIFIILSVMMGTIIWDQVHEVNNRIPRPNEVVIPREVPLIGGVRPFEPLIALMESLSLWQNWRMFAPNPVFDAGPWVAPGVLTDGTPVDALANVPGFAEPPPYRLIYSRWNKFRLHIRTPEQRGYLLWFGKYLCRQHNIHRKPGEPMLDNFELIYQMQKTHAPWEEKVPMQPTVMWKHYCIKVPEK